MPTRYLKPGIRDSEKIDSVSFEAECLFYRLLVTVDDFGRYDGRPSMIKAACFPIKESITIGKTNKLISELCTNDLVVVYEINNKPYLQVSSWDNKPRASESKYPAFEDGCMQVYASVCSPRTCVPLTKTETETETETETCPAIAPDEIPEEILEHLNAKTGKSYRPVESNLKLIRARMKEGHSQDDIKAVIDMKANQWKHDPKMFEYLRPATLFGAEKFNQYIGDVGAKKPMSDADKARAWVNGSGEDLPGSNVFEGVFIRE